MGRTGALASNFCSYIAPILKQSIDSAVVFVVGVVVVVVVVAVVGIVVGGGVGGSSAFKPGPSHLLQY